MGQQDFQKNFLQFFQRILKDYRLCLEKRTTTSKRIKVWRQVWAIPSFVYHITRKLLNFYISFRLLKKCEISKTVLEALPQQLK